MQEEVLMNISKQLETLIDMLSKEAGRGTVKVGRPSKKHIVVKFRNTYPTYTKSRCIQITGLSSKTVSKYWDAQDE
jgi:hypothetical protein